MRVVHDALDAAVDLRGRAGEVDLHRFAAHSDPAGDERALVVEAVGSDVRCPGAVWHLRDRPAHGAVRPLPQRRGKVVEIRQASVLEELQDAAGADLDGDDLRLKVAQHLPGDPDISQQDVDHLLVPPAFAQKMPGWDADAFLEDLAAIGRPKGTTDIR